MSRIEWERQCGNVEQMLRGQVDSALAAMPDAEVDGNSGAGVGRDDEEAEEEGNAGTAITAHDLSFDESPAMDEVSDDKVGAIADSGTPIEQKNDRFDYENYDDYDEEEM